jgi:hypothetical protein
VAEHRPPEGPWSSYNRDSLRPGWAHPLRQGQIREALSAGGARVGHVGLLQGDNSWTPPVGIVVWIHWPDHRVHGGGVWQGERLALMYLFAVPTERRVEVTDLLLAGPLDAACRWAAGAPQRGNAWGSSEHHFRLGYKAGKLTSSES